MSMSRLAIGIICLWCVPAWALPVEPLLPDPAEEAAARAVFREVRCAVCQGESIADSPAEVARDMRRDIRAQIADGKREEEILAYFAAHYGDSILMRPPLTLATAPLWLAPWLVLVAAAFLAYGYFRKSDDRPL